MSASLPGLFPQGFSFMAILELSAGASLAPRLWWAERALGIALVSAGLATAAPAYADQTCWLPTMALCAAKPRRRI
jgi:conjugal transfer pilus assembly protein TraK